MKRSLKQAPQAMKRAQRGVAHASTNAAKQVARAARSTADAATSGLKSTQQFVADSWASLTPEQKRELKKLGVTVIVTAAGVVLVVSFPQIAPVVTAVLKVIAAVA